MLKNTIFQILLIFTLAIVEMATDVYTPSLPLLKKFFMVDEDMVQLTISLNLLGIAISGFFYGPLSDSYGRKRLMLGGITIFFLGSFVCAFAADIWTLIAARFLQGIGAGCAWVLALAMVGDSYEKEESLKIISLLGITMSLSPAISPSLGSVIGEFFGWQTNFVILTVISGVLIFFLWKFLPETLETQQRHPFSLNKIAQRAGEVLRNKIFLSNALISGFIFASLWSFIATAPFVFDLMGVHQIHFGLYTLLVVSFYGVGAVINRYSLNYVTSGTLTFVGLLGTLLGGIILFWVSQSPHQSLTVILGVVGIYTFFMSFVFSNVASMAIDSVESSLGIASSMMSGIEMIMAAITICLVGTHKSTDFSYVALGFIFSSIMSIIVFKILSSYQQQK